MSSSCVWPIAANIVTETKKPFCNFWQIFKCNMIYKTSYITFPLSLLRVAFTSIGKSINFRQFYTIRGVWILQYSAWIRCMWGPILQLEYFSIHLEYFGIHLILRYSLGILQYSLWEYFGIRPHLHCSIQYSYPSVHNQILWRILRRSKPDLIIVRATRWVVISGNQLLLHQVLLSTPFCNGGVSIALHAFPSIQEAFHS